MLKLSYIATCSREEGEFIFITRDPKKAAEKALKHGVEIVSIELGSEGAHLKSKGDTEVSAPAFKAKALDTTGAGDGWNAGLLVGLCRGRELERCIKVANAVGALLVTKHSAITASPYKNELNEFLSRREESFEV